VEWLNQKNQEEMVKNSIVLIAVVLCAAAVSAPAKATTCKQRADNCNRLGGGAACYEQSRMASCASNKVYVAPSGRSWEANGPGKK
jgi:hypothetical protein